MIEPDVILPSRFLPRTRATPERRLLLAVLEEAIGTYQRHTTATAGHAPAILAEVEAWFACEDDTWLYSFVAICDALGIEATYVRSGLGLLRDTRRTRPPWTTHPGLRFPFRRVNGMRHRTTGRAQGMSRRA